ncbi:hypothetical protein [Oceanicoccus sp. KOV_DT_Chl]|uniref:hypothetical protein n=1 Tax=Oceanicoccus sp. KOV_DT_Chl TaxID=1904639 RepID=UPI000C7A6A73|nr:hypothetical protein [Oceanicoccus sp. KOV_DT_Chl]
MKKNIIAIILISAFVTPAIADKPEWAGKGKPTAEQKDAHRSAMEIKEELEGGDLKEEKKEKSSELSGVEKQTIKKSEQEQKELDKGSDKGKESREANSKKWWKFWGE